MCSRGASRGARNASAAHQWAAAVSPCARAAGMALYDNKKKSIFRFPPFLSYVRTLARQSLG